MPGTQPRHASNLAEALTAINRVKQRPARRDGRRHSPSSSRRTGSAGTSPPPWKASRPVAWIQPRPTPGSALTTDRRGGPRRRSFNVVEPVRAVVAIQNYLVGTSQIAQTTLRSILGQVELHDLLIKRDEINQQLQQIIDDLTNPWGIKVTLVEVKDVELPETMRRAMGRQAEAERERRSKVIHAQGELEAAESLGQAAAVLESHPAAMQLRQLSTMVEVAAGENSTLISRSPWSCSTSWTR
ncbi:MAG: SPFH domain-containing protein [Acidimicrobiales bacterium]